MSQTNAAKVVLIAAVAIGVVIFFGPVEAFNRKEDLRLLLSDIPNDADSAEVRNWKRRLVERQRNKDRIGGRA